MPIKDSKASSDKPFVSVIMPAYNHAKFLANAVTSIQRQNYSPLEIIIIDDGSVDGTTGAVNRLPEPIRYYYQKNKGPASARNKGLICSRGDLIAFLDSDDLWPPGKLNLQTEYLLEESQCEIVLGLIQRVSMDETSEMDPGEDDAVMGVHLGCGLFRRSVFDKVGLFDETLRYSEDHDWFLRAREMGISMTVLQETTLYYNVHGKNMTLAKEEEGFQLPAVLKKSLDRRRLQNKGQVKPLPKLSSLTTHSRAHTSGKKEKESHE